MAKKTSIGGVQVENTKVKILGLAFSPRHGNTEVIVREALKAAEELPGVETKFFSIAGKTINGCISCYRCYRARDPKKPCQSITDAYDDIAPLLQEADGIILGSPVYYMGVTAQMKAFMDRTMSLQVLGYALRNKVLGCVTVAYDREGGLETTIQDMQKWGLCHDMIIASVGPEHGPGGFGGYLGAMALQGYPDPVSSSVPGALEVVKKDAVGMYASRSVGYRTAELAKVIKMGFDKIDKKELKWPRGTIDLHIAPGWKKE